MIGECLHILSIFLSEGVDMTKGMALTGVLSKEYNQISTWSFI
ncbi:hypothetical protein QUF70_14180 [Desulfobacterales bacterium HSG17]|nr:hypothetical protein [Desulfobacterales bacterium HSG17]